MDKIINNADVIENKIEQEINLKGLIHKINNSKNIIYKSCIFAFLLGLIVAFSIPEEYTTSVILAPEAKAKSGSGNLGALASMAGINIGSVSSDEALSPEIYPDIVKSTPFLIDLFPVKIVTIEESKSMNLFEYMYIHQVSPWWKEIIYLPIKGYIWITSSIKNKTQNNIKNKPDTFRLTQEQAEVAARISDRIITIVNEKTGMISISVTMQDPLVSATLTDTVMQNLQDYITRYRTNKAKQDLEYTEKLYKEAQQNYYEAQQKYANFADSNLDIVMTGYQTRLERLQNEATLAYGLYNQISQQLQLAKAKVQEVTPVYTVVQPASVPLRPASPQKPIILIGFVFLAFVGSVGWILFIKDLVKQFKRS